MAQSNEFSHYTYEQLMKLTRNKLRDVSKLFNITYTGKTLKQELAANIAKYNNKKFIILMRQHLATKFRMTQSMCHLTTKSRHSLQS